VTAARDMWRRLAADPWLLAIAGITALALALRLVDIGHQSFWYDESLTVQEVRLRFLRMLSNVRDHEVTPPLYFISAWTWAKLFGSGAAALRSLSAFAGALTVPAAAACAATLAGRRAALVTAALVAANPLLVWYSQEARSYALLALLATLSWLFFLRALRGGGARDLWLWALASALALFTHYFGLFIVAPEAAWLLLRARNRRRALAPVGLVVASGMVLLPFAVNRRSSGTGWIAGTPLWLRMRQLPEQLVAGFSDSQLVALGGAGVVAVALLLIVVGRNRRARGAAIAAALIASLIVALPFALGRFGLDYLVTRNVIYVAVPLSVLVASGLAAPRRPWAAVGGTALLCALMLFATVRIASTTGLQRPDWQAVARALGPRHGNRALVVAGSYRARPLIVYLPDTNYLGTPAAAVREIDVIGMRSPPQKGCWWGAGCNLPTAFPATRPPAPAFHLVSRRHVGHFMILTFRARRAAKFGACSTVYRSQRRFRGHALHSVLVLLQRGIAIPAATPPYPSRAHIRHQKRRHPGSHRRGFGCAPTRR
jgi:hypothetical protein